MRACVPNIVNTVSWKLLRIFSSNLHLWCTLGQRFWSGKVTVARWNKILLETASWDAERIQGFEVFEVGGCCRPRAWYKCRYENSHVKTSSSYDRTRLNRYVKIIWNILKITSLNGRTIDRLLRCLHISDAVARCLQQPITDVRRWRMRCGL